MHTYNCWGGKKCGDGQNNFKEKGFLQHRMAYVFWGMVCQKYLEVTKMFYTGCKIRSHQSEITTMLVKLHGCFSSLSKVSVFTIGCMIYMRKDCLRRKIKS